METTTKQPLILIVDDIPANLHILGSILLEKKYQLQVANNGFEAIEIAIKSIPDLILLDIQMPEINGYEVCQRLKANPSTADIPIIFLTAFNELNNIVQGFEVGGVDYIIKPYQAKELLMRVNTHLELKFAKENVIRLNATKDKFFSIIAHDLRGPIASLNTLLKIITSSDNSMSNDTVLGIFQQLQKSADSTSWLLDNLFTWARSNRGEITFNPLNNSIFEITQANINLYQTAAINKNIILANEVASDVEWIFDYNMITTVIRNLINNALKFTPNGGSIVVSTKTNNQTLVIEVADTGIGMTESQIEKLFDYNKNIIGTSYGTNGEKGSGLGLVLCKEFIDKHNGKIWVESEQNKGSRFMVLLPRVN